MFGENIADVIQEKCAFKKSRACSAWRSRCSGWMQIMSDSDGTERFILYQLQNHIYTCALPPSWPPASSARRYIDLRYIRAPHARRFLNGSSSFPSNAATQTAAPPVTEWDVGRTVEEKKKEKRFLLGNPNPDWDFAISRKQLAKGRTGLCQTKQTADRVQRQSLR